MSTLRLTCAALLLVAPLFAQAPATPTLHIPAGDWTVRDLLTQAEQALRTPITADATELAQATAERIRLQFPLALDPAHGQEAIAALLSARGLLLTRGANGAPEVRATPKGKPEWLREHAVPCTLQELLDYPFRHGVVRTELRTSVQAQMLTEMLRMSAASGAATPSCEAVRDGIACTGTSDAVRHAITQVAALDPQFAAALPQASHVSIVGGKKGDAVALPAGDHPLVDVVDVLAKNGGFNIVLSPTLAASAAKLTTAKAQQFDWQHGPGALTTLLWQHRVLLLELDVRHGLYEAVLVENQRQAPPMTRASTRTVDEAIAAADCTMFIAVQWKAKHLGIDKRMELVRAAMGGGDPSGIGMFTACGTPDGLLLSGLSPQIAKLLKALQAADQPSGG